VLLVRYRPGIVGETSRTVHVVTLPTDKPTRVVGARCGAVLRPADLEVVAPGEGMPCTMCVLHCVTDATPAEMPRRNGPDRADTAGPAPSGLTYQQWGWPVTLHRDQIRLHLNHAVSAWMIHAPRCAEVIPVLTERRCAPLVIAHPYAGEHQIVLTGEKYGLPLPWPEQVHRVTGVLLLPPTRTLRGPITWITTPHPDCLRLCREIDLFTALRSTADG
jgi:hypothetical protein